MKLAVISHKICWKSGSSPSGFVTDGGFPLQMRAISELFDETKVVVPCNKKEKGEGTSPLKGNNLKIVSLSVPKGKGILRKFTMLSWLIQNSSVIWREVRQADAVHTPIPGDIGTIGMLFALILKKPLFVRHCGNWFVQRTAAEHFWKWSMENFAGGRNVMLATGGDENAPSSRNANIKWIFSTSLTQKEINYAAVRDYPADGKLKLITACRLEKRKGVEIVIESLPLILQKFPGATLDIIGGGALLDDLKSLAKTLKIEDKIVFHGKIEHKQVLIRMKQAHVFCYPTSASEGFPKVVLEALACGLPVITTKVSVLPQLLSGGAGVLLDQATGAALAKGVSTVCFNADAYKKMSACALGAAREYSLENWRDFIGEKLRQAWKVSSLSAAI